MNKTSEILIIGGGLIGTSLAYYLAKASVSVTLLELNSEPAAPGTASWGSAGIISPPSRMQTPPALLTLIKRSLELYPTLVSELPAPTGYRELYQLSLAANGAEVRGLQKRQQWQTENDFEARWLLPDEVTELEPLAGPNAGGLYNRAAVVDTRLLTGALAQGAADLGAQILTGQRARNLWLEGGQVRGVNLANGEKLSAAKVVLAAGAWSGAWLSEQLTGLGLPAGNFGRAVWPVRGQMLAVQPTTDVQLQHVLVGGHGYALPHLSGTIYFGATIEPEAGFENTLTPAGMLELGRLVHKLTPLLDNASVVRQWSALRPGSLDELPLLGPLEQLPGLWLATGHFRNGVLLTPASAELVGQALLSGQALPEEFSPNRTFPT